MSRDWHWATSWKSRRQVRNRPIEVDPMHNGMRVTPTRYDGVTFRSRTEAHWAAAFKERALAYEYELESFDLPGLGWYMPDFWMPELKVWIEVKGIDPTRWEIARCRELKRWTRQAVFVAIGSPSEGRIFCVTDDRFGALEISAVAPHWWQSA